MTTNNSKVTGTCTKGNAFFHCIVHPHRSLSCTHLHYQQLNPNFIIEIGENCNPHCTTTVIRSTQRFVQLSQLQQWELNNVGHSLNYCTNISSNFPKGNSIYIQILNINSCKEVSNKMVILYFLRRWQRITTIMPW